MIAGFFIGYFTGGFIAIIIYSIIVVGSRCEDDENS